MPVVCDEGHQPIEITVHQTCCSARSSPFYLWIAQVFSGRQKPRALIDLRETPLEVVRESGQVAARQTPALLVKTLFQHEGRQSGGGHALAVDWVEATRRVAEDDEALRPW